MVLSRVVKCYPYEAFSVQIARAGIGLNDELCTKLASLYEYPDLRRGIQARMSIAEGLLFGTKGEAHSHLVKTLLEQVTPSKNQARLFRKTLELARNLDARGVNTFDTGTDLQETHGLLKGRLVDEALDKLGLEGDDIKEKLQSNIESFLLSGFIEVVPQLLGQYEQKSEDRAMEVLREASRRYILGDFHDWRMSHERATEQLKFLPEGVDRVSWTEPAGATKVSFDQGDVGELRENVIRAAQGRVTEARAHMRDLVGFELTPETLTRLRDERDGLIQKLKSPETPKEKKRDIGVEKMTFDAQITLLEGIEEIRRIDDYTGADVGRLKDLLGGMRTAATRLELEQVASDIDQGVLALSAELIPAPQSITANDSDEPLALLKSGTEPRETCQSWKQGMYNEGLVATLADVDKRLIQATDDKGNVQGRALVRGRLYVDESDYQRENPRPLMLIEPMV